jgi:RNA polymerase sigma factor (sigma-70 family)
MIDDITGVATEVFVAHRNLLFTVAYEMLGSAADAEDVLQETWLRWVRADLGRVSDQRAYLVRITTRQALNRLRTVKRRREAYVGPWLPEPLVTAPDVAEDVELAESMSMAMMLVLESLSPTERAVFVLREVFEVDYDEIAEAVGKNPDAVRQIAHRARKHVGARRPRTRPGRRPAQRWRRPQESRLASDRRRREDHPLLCRRHRQAPGHGHLGADRGQRQPRARRACGRRPRRRHGRPRGELPYQRPVLRPQPRQADPRHLRDPARPALTPARRRGSGPVE